MAKSLLAQRVQSFGTTIFTEMNALAAEHQAINLAQGVPDFAAPDEVKQAAIAAILADANQYAPSAGIDPLRQAIAETYRLSYNLPATADDVTVTSGATEALFVSMLALVDPGDEVVLFEPAFDAYMADVLIAGGVPRCVRLYPPTPAGAGAQLDWTFDPDELRAAFGPATRAILLNTPHNPTGKVFSYDELQFIAELCCTYNVIVLADEVYDRIIFEGTHIPIATLPGMWERTITINTTGKTFSLTGWKVSYAIAPRHLSEALRRVHQFNTFASATPLQHGLAHGLRVALEGDYYRQLRGMYRERRDLIVRLLQETGFEVIVPRATYFVMAGFRRWNFEADVAFCRYLISEVGVAALPPSVFYADPQTAPPMARFCFAKRTATLEAAAARLREGWCQRSKAD